MCIRDSNWPIKFIGENPNQYRSNTPTALEFEMQVGNARGTTSKSKVDVAVSDSPTASISDFRRLDEFKSGSLSPARFKAEFIERDLFLLWNDLNFDISRIRWIWEDAPSSNMKNLIKGFLRDYSDNNQFQSLFSSTEFYELFDQINLRFHNNTGQGYLPVRDAAEFETNFLDNSLRYDNFFDTIFEFH